MRERSLLGNRLSRLLSIALGIAIGVAALAHSVPPAGASEGESSEPLEPMQEGAEVEKATRGPIPHPSAISRGQVRAWAEKLGLPEVRLTPLPDNLMPTHETATTSTGITPEDADEIVIHKADQAHALGFDGRGVRVAVVDTGIDFAHPDLFNVTARVTNPASPYFLHPIAYDGASMNDYLVFGNAGPNSWYVNTSFSTTVFEVTGGRRQVSWTDGFTTLIWDVTGVAGLDLGEEVRLGFHPDEKLVSLRGSRPGLLLFNAAGAGPPFDTVRVDLDGDFSFGAEKPARINTAWATFDPEAELIFRDLNGDGMQDTSGGMVYFIADGVREIPYASRQIQALNFTFQTRRNNNSFDAWTDLGVDPTANLIPGAGDLVLLFGDFGPPGAFGAHGTWVTSALVGQGITGGGAVGPVIRGMAPGAKIIGAGNNFAGADPFGQMGLWTSLIFATEGYDGAIDTGDEAHIASNSWGSSDWTGWEWGARFVDYISTIQADERTLFVFGSGNSGPGYGGRQGPAGGASLLVAGAMENYHYRTDPWFFQDGGLNPSSGETTWFSNRGPSAMGRHLVDALTSGQFGYGADALNDNPFDADSGTALNGNSSWVLWSGTSLSTPNLAGVTALVYDAYMAAHGGLAPLASTAKAIVKNSADDAHQDPFLTGAGIANALRGVRIANEADGLTMSVHEWYPGDYRGVVYPGYSQMLLPGGMDSVVVSAKNHRPSSVLAVDVQDAVLAQTNSLSMSFSRLPLSVEELFLLADAGILATNGSVLVAAPSGAYASADAIRVSMFFDRGRMTQAPFYLLRLFDWTDVDASGSFDGVNERNLMMQDWISNGGANGPNGFAFVHDPANRTHDGLVINLNPFFEGTVFGAIGFTLQVDYFQRVDFPWLQVAPASLVIGPASSAPVTLTVTVPGDADPGLYEAVVLFRLDNGNVTTLPVVVNVAAPALPLTYGGNTHDSGPYQQGVQYGAWWDGMESQASGDFRYFFFDLPAATPLTVLLTWNDFRSDHDLFILSNKTDWFSENLPSRYGPGTVDTVGFGPGGPLSASLQVEMNAGLGIIVARSRFLAGLAAEEHPIGEAGIITVNPSPWTAAGVPVDGSETFTIVSELAFPDLTGSVETGSILALKDQTVIPYPCPPACGSEAGFRRYLFNAPDKIKTEIAADVTKAEYTLFFHSGARDIDMGIFYDANCDGAYTVDDDTIGFVASTDRNPEVATINGPAAGCYWVHAAGFDVDPGSLYDLTVNLISQPFITVASLPPRIDPGVPVEVGVTYSLPRRPETFGGSVLIGSSRFPRAIGIRVSLTPDLPPVFSNETPGRDAVINEPSPTISVEMRDFADPFESAVAPGSVGIRLDGVNFTSFATVGPTSITLPLASVLGDGSHLVNVSAADLVGSRSTNAWSFTVDTSVPVLEILSPDVAVTNDPVVLVSGVTEVGVNLTVGGQPASVESNGRFNATLTLPEGMHAIDVVARDAAGNANTAVVAIEVDTTPPVLALTSPTDESSTGEPTVLVAGSTEPGATVQVNGLRVDVAPNGSFSVLLALDEGANTITATATDVAGNTATASVNVSFNSPVPGLEQNLGFLQVLVAVLAGALVAVGALAFLLWWRTRRRD